MSEVGLARRIAPAILIAVAGGVLLYLLPSGADSDTSSAEDVGAETASSAAPAASGAASSSAASTPSGKRSIKGDAVNFRYGTVQVKVVLDGTTITDLKTITAPGGGYQGWTDRAVPTMKAEILAAQSTHVAAASGATYTSKAYAQSVQSALDRA